MSKIAIVTDSNSGITQAEGKELGVYVMPMPFYINDELFLEDITLSQEQFYEVLTEGKEIHTSSPALTDFTELWDKLLKEYDYIIDIPMSSGLSSTCEQAIMLSKEEEYDGKVFVVDNQRISVTMRRSVIDAKEMADAGLDFITTQMFFDNAIFYNFLYRAREKGIQIPVIAGIMPITNARQLQRSVAMSGTDVPHRFRAIVDFFGDDPASMKQAGIVYASEQIIDLIANGIRHIHVYTMNKPDVAAGIMQNLSEIWKKGSWEMD